MNSLEGHSARIASLEKMADQHATETKELRSDIRSLTAAVAELSKAVAVLSQRVSDAVAYPAPPAPPAEAGGIKPAHVAGAGAAGGGIVAACIEVIQYLRGMH